MKQDHQRVALGAVLEIATDAHPSFFADHKIEITITIFIEINK